MNNMMILVDQANEFNTCKYRFLKDHEQYVFSLITCNNHHQANMDTLFHTPRDLVQW